MSYKKGDIVSVEALKVKGTCDGGRLFVKIIKKKDGLYFGPLLQKHARSVPISVIDYFEPLNGISVNKEIYTEIDSYAKRLDALHKQVLWGVIFNTWKETRQCLAVLKDL